MILLPYPPSQNDIYSRHNGSKLSERYRKWRDEAGWMLKEQHTKPIFGPVSVSVAVVAPDKRRRDLDNVGFKAILDLLVKHGVIEADDSRIVREIHARWADSGHSCSVEVLPFVTKEN